MSGNKDFLLKEMELRQKILDKQDDWFIRMRVGLVVGLFALISLPFTISAGRVEGWRVFIIGIALAVFLYIGEVIARWTQQYGYILRHNTIEEALNRDVPYVPPFKIKEDSIPVKHLYLSIILKFYKKKKFNKKTYKKFSHCFLQPHYLFYLIAVLLFGLSILILRLNHEPVTMLVFLHRT